jgi:hypothetical protein
MAAIGRQALTALLPVRAGREASLAAALVNTGPRLTERLHAGKTLHFARLVLVPSGDVRVDGRPASASLLLETTYDGELSAHVAELFSLAFAELAPLLAECEGVSASGGLDAFEATLRHASRQPWAFAARNGELGVTEIRRDAMLRENVHSLLERERPSLVRQRPLEILVSLQSSLGLRSGTAGGEPREPPPRDAVELLLVLARLVPLALGMLLHDLRERVLGLWHDRRDATRPSSPVANVAVPTSRSAQRGFTHLSLAKPGRFRRGALRRALALMDALLASGAVERSAPGAHALRFVLLEDGRLLFTSQHDGSLASRLAGLGRRVTALLALVWSSTEGFPRALLGHLLGKTDDERLLEWLRTYELSTGFCYSAYPTLTTHDVAVNAELRALLSAEPTDARARRLLELV